MNLTPLLYWAREREAIRLRKEAGEPWPWTADPILRQYSFCCVRREDDRVTRWIAANIRTPYADDADLCWMLCAARQINWDPTLRALIDNAWPSLPDFSPAAITAVLEGISARGEKWHTGAYLISPGGSGGGASKPRYIAEVVLGRLWEDRAEFSKLFAGHPGLRETWAALRQYKGWGAFMAYQAVVDMRFTHLLHDAPDRETWAAAGPGTLRGLNRLAGRPTRAPLRQEQALEEILEIYPVLKSEFPNIDLSDVPNVLCETDKYLRVKLGEGRPRALYHPRVT